jgi:hypothetical protein
MIPEGQRMDEKLVELPHAFRYSLWLRCDVRDGG